MNDSTSSEQTDFHIEGDRGPFAVPGEDGDVVIHCQGEAGAIGVGEVACSIRCVELGCDVGLVLIERNDVGKGFGEKAVDFFEGDVVLDQLRDDLQVIDSGDDRVGTDGFHGVGSRFFAGDGEDRRGVEDDVGRVTFVRVAAGHMAIEVGCSACCG